MNVITLMIAYMMSIHSWTSYSASSITVHPATIGAVGASYHAALGDTSRCHNNYGERKVIDSAELVPKPKEDTMIRQKIKNLSEKYHKSLRIGEQMAILLVWFMVVCIIAVLSVTQCWWRFVLILVAEMAIIVPGIMIFLP